MSLSKAKIALFSLTRFKPFRSDDPFKGLSTVALIGMGFSANDKTDPGRKPGKSNEQIALVMTELWQSAQSRGVKTLVLPQREVAEALQKNHSEVPIDQVLQEVGNEKHISSHDILGQAWRFAKEKGVTDAILCAHYRHASRSEWNARLWGFNVHHPHRHAMVYAPESTQLHTHNAPFFFIWEALSRAKLFLLDRPS